MKTRDELARLAEQAHDGWRMGNEDGDPWSDDAWKHVATAILAADVEWIHQLTDRLTAERDPNYKDEWERGYDAGQMAVGYELKHLLGVPK